MLGKGGGTTSCPIQQFTEGRSLVPPLKPACCWSSSCYGTAWPPGTCPPTFLCVLLFSVFLISYLDIYLAGGAPFLFYHLPTCLSTCSSTCCCPCLPTSSAFHPHGGGGGQPLTPICACSHRVPVASHSASPCPALPVQRGQGDPCLRAAA